MSTRSTPRTLPVAVPPVSRQQGARSRQGQTRRAPIMSASTPHTSQILPNHRNLAIRSQYTDNVWFAFRQLMMALLGHDVMGGSGDGGGRRGVSKKTGGEGFYKEIIDTLLFRKCVPCVRTCLQQMRVKINTKLVVRYTKTLFQTIDVAFKSHHGISLSQYVYNVLSETKLSPAFDVYTKYKAGSKRKEVRVFKYFLMDIIAEVLPTKLEGVGFAALKPEILKFLAKDGGDVSMVAGAAVDYILKAYRIEGVSLPSVPCLVCHAFNTGCQIIRRNKNM